MLALNPKTGKRTSLLARAWSMGFGSNLKIMIVVSIRTEAEWKVAPVT
jgi:hypothetical protein